MPRREVVAFVVVCLVAVGAFFLANRKPSSVATPKPPIAASGASGTSTSEAPPPETRVRRVTVAEHQQLAERIAAARGRARDVAATQSSGETPSPALPDDDAIRLEQVSTKVRASLDESIPILAECFHDKTPKQTAVVVMTMYSDPSVGMVIDTGEMKDGNDKPLPAELDDCLRTAIDSLALPPLEVGGHLPLQYSFVF